MTEEKSANCEADLSSSFVSPELVLGIRHPLVVTVGNKLRVAMAVVDIDGTTNDEQELEAQRLSTVGPAMQAFSELQALGISVGMGTARSFGEATMYQEATRAFGMTISEDGAVVVLPSGIPETVVSLLKSKYHIIEHEGRNVILVSQVNSADIKQLVEDFKQKYHSKIVSSFDSPERVQSVVGHATVDDARRSIDRLASGYIWGFTENEKKDITAMAEKRGMRTFGELLHIIGLDVDKGVALAVVDEIVRSLLPQYDGIYPIVMGNSTNDIALLMSVYQICGGGLGFLVSQSNTKQQAWIYPHESEVPSYSIHDTSILPKYVTLLRRPYGYGLIDAVNEIKRTLLQK